MACSYSVIWKSQLQMKLWFIFSSHSMNMSWRSQCFSLLLVMLTDRRHSSLLIALWSFFMLLVMTFLTTRAVNTWAFVSLLVYGSLPFFAQFFLEWRNHRLVAQEYPHIAREYPHTTDQMQFSYVAALPDDMQYIMFLVSTSKWITENVVISCYTASLPFDNWERLESLLDMCIWSVFVTSSPNPSTSNVACMK